MSTDPNIFECFLDPAEIYVLYQKIGNVLKNDRDIANEYRRGKALYNTLLLLQRTAMIQKLDDSYIKLSNCFDRDAFFAALLESIKKTFGIEVAAIISCDKHYDEAKNQFFIHVNSIPLRYMGLAMLMEQTGEFERIGNREYFIGIKNYDKVIKKKPSVTIEALQKKLQRDIECGEQAELFAWRYEETRLKRSGINRAPLRVSSIDVMAGYDIVSYESESSGNYDRFIEVKAASDSGFYWSKNEYETAKLKGDRYYLYLVDLKKTGDSDYAPEIIQDPVINVMETDGWFVEPQSYHIKRV